MMKRIKNKKRVKQTVLIYCEGQQDSLFVQHLKKLFSHNHKRFKIQAGHGGSLSTMIKKVVRQPAEYDKIFIFLDSDQQKNKEHESKAKDEGITLIFSPLCLENLFLQILNGHPQMFSARKCKSFFKEKYECDKYNLNLMENLFPKELLNDKKEKIPVLKQLIQAVS